jgi:transcription antitermination factor NusG
MTSAWGEGAVDARCDEAGPVWHVLWTRSHCEQVVRDQLAARGFEPFLPMINVWSKRGGSRHLIRRPMFPGYLFLSHPMDKSAYIAVRQARGLVNLLGERWDRLAEVPQREIEAARALSQSPLPSMPYPYLKDGMRVRIVRGPLADVEGLLVRRKADKGLLVLSVDLLQRSVAVEVECTSAVPA